MEHQVNVIGGRPGDAERPQESGVAALGRGGRMSRQRKSAAVLRLLRGEDLETVSRELGVTAATLTNWHDAFLDTFDLTEALAVTASGRFNHAEIRLQDGIGTAAQRRQPLQPVQPCHRRDLQACPWATTYAGYSEANRAPTPAELGCADPAGPACWRISWFPTRP